jgi:hypothetical protein
MVDRLLQWYAGEVGDLQTSIGASTVFLRCGLEMEISGGNVEVLKC